MRIILIYLSLLVFSNTSSGQDIDKISKIMGPNPLLFVDSVEVDISILQKIDPIDVANIEILKPKTARKIYGIRGDDGAMRVTTKSFASLNYWRFLSTISPEYLNAVPTPESDTSIVYILNDSVMTVNPSGNLYLVNKKNFRKLTILTRSELSDKYGIADKRFGVLVKTKKKKNSVKT